MLGNRISRNFISDLRRSCEKPSNDTSDFANGTNDDSDDTNGSLQTKIEIFGTNDDDEGDTNDDAIANDIYK